MIKGDLVKLHYARKDIGCMAGIVVKEYVRIGKCDGELAWHVWWFDSPVRNTPPVLDRSLRKLGGQE